MEATELDRRTTVEAGTVPAQFATLDRDEWTHLEAIFHWGPNTRADKVMGDERPMRDGTDKTKVGEIVQEMNIND